MLLLFLSVAAAAVRFIVLAVESGFIEGRIIHIIILLVTVLVLADAECIAVLTKSKRCWEALDT